MRKNLVMKISLTIIMLCTLLFKANAAPDVTGKVKKIWPHILMQKGANYQEFKTLIKNQKFGYIEKMMEMLVKAVKDISEAGGFTTVPEVMEAILTFNGLYETDLAKAHELMPRSLSADFSSALHELFNKHPDAKANQKFIFTHGKLLDFVIDNRNKNVSIPLKYKKTEVDYVMTGVYSIVDRSKISIALSLINIHTGMVETGFNIISLPENASKDLALKFFDYFQKNKSPTFVDPNSGLEWIFQSASMRHRGMISRGEASSYCKGQGYRFPFAQELLKAAGAGFYAPGGYELNYTYNSCYYIKDNWDWEYGDDGAYNYYTGVDEHKTMNRIHFDHANQKCYMVCVKGKPSDADSIVDQLYEKRREETDYNMKKVIAYLIKRLDPLTTLTKYQVDKSYYKTLKDVDQYIKNLKANGYLK